MSSYAKFDLLSNASATGTAVMWPGGVGVWAVDGTFGGATVTLQVMSPDGTNYVALLGWDDTIMDFTAEGARVFCAPAGNLRALVAGGSPSALYSYAIKI